MCYPGAVMPGVHLPYLVLPYFVERLGVRQGVALYRNLRRHPAHRVDAAAMAGADQEVDVRFQEMAIHRDASAVGKDELGPAAEFLDGAEDVVPAAAVESRGVIAQLVEDLVHLERGGNRLDEHGRADGAAGQAERVLRRDEHVVPQPRLEMALELREIEVRAAPRLPPDQRTRIEEREDRTVQERCRNRRRINGRSAVTDIS